MLNNLPREFSLSSILGAGVIVGTCVAWWVGKLDTPTALAVLGVGGTWAGLPQRQSVPTVATPQGEAVPVATAPQEVVAPVERHPG